MDGRIRAGWYRRPDDPEGYVYKVARIGQSWIASAYDLRHGGPCAAGVHVTLGWWRRLEPYEGPLSPRMEADAGNLPETGLC